MIRYGCGCRGDVGVGVSRGCVGVDGAECVECTRVGVLCTKCSILYNFLRTHIEFDVVFNMSKK